MNLESENNDTVQVFLMLIAATACGFGLLAQCKPAPSGSFCVCECGARLILSIDCFVGSRDGVMQSNRK